MQATSMLLDCLLSTLVALISQTMMFYISFSILLLGDVRVQTFIGIVLFNNFIKSAITFIVV